MRVPPDRDIDLVLVTGAGASREFGVNYTNLPLMKEWCASLLISLRRGAPGFAEAVGLSEYMSGPDFENRLGIFLAAAQAFPAIKTLVDPLGTMLAASPPATHGNSNNTWESWHGQAQHQLEQVMAVIHSSLYENFGEPSYDPGLVQNAFQTLLAHLGITRTSRWVYATTNYDVIADAAIEALGAGVDDGTAQRRFQPSAERSFRVEGLVGRMGRDVPLIHLHGRIGWYSRTGVGSGTGPYALDHVRAYDPAQGVPLVMLPDPNKDPDNGNVVIGEMWLEFRHALERAKRVLVLGHSLHDDPLVGALSAHAPRPGLAVALLSAVDNPDDFDADATAVEAKLVERLPEAHRILMRFGPQYGPSPPPTMTEWLTFTSDERR